MGQEEGRGPGPSLALQKLVSVIFGWAASCSMEGVGADPAFCCGECQAVEKGKRHKVPRVNAGDLPRGNTDIFGGKGNSVLLETHMVFGKGRPSWRM